MEFSSAIEAKLPLTRFARATLQAGSKQRVRDANDLSAMWSDALCLAGAGSQSYPVQSGRFQVDNRVNSGARIGCELVVSAHFQDM
jgi:hypothetical protein